MDAWTAYTMLAMILGGMLSKALTPTLAFMLGLVLVYPDTDRAQYLVPAYFVAVFIAGFREV